MLSQKVIPTARGASPGWRKCMRGEITMRKLFKLLSVIFVFALGVGVISAQDSLESVDPKGQEIVYWHQYQNDSAQGKTIAAIVDQFNKTNEWGIKTQLGQ